MRAVYRKQIEIYFDSVMKGKLVKTHHWLNPDIMEEIFAFRNTNHNLDTSLELDSFKTGKYGTESSRNKMV